MLTRSPRSFSSLPMLDAVRPLPRLEATPPVTKRCRVVAGRDACAEIANDAPVVRSGGTRSPTGYQNIRPGAARWADTRHDTAGMPDLTAIARYWRTELLTPPVRRLAGVRRGPVAWFFPVLLASFAKPGQRQCAGYGEDETQDGNGGQTVSG